MTAACVGGGTSSRKQGIAEVLLFGAASIASRLNNRGGVWASVIAPLMGVIEFDATQICSTDPPAMPTFSALEVVELFAVGGALASTATLQKWNDLCVNVLWYELCQCDAGAAPVPPALPAAPVGLPDTTQLYSGTGVTGPCYTVFNTADHSQNLGVYQMLANPDQNGNSTMVILPAGGRDLQTAASITPHGTTHASNWHVVIRWFDATTVISTEAAPTHPPDGNIYTDTFATAPTGAIQFSVEIVSGTVATVTDLAFVQANVFCGGPQGSVQTACCPADQYQTAMLQQILDYVRLLQRQLSPFAHVSGTVHAALSGQGTLNVSGLLGVKLDLTTIPSSYGVAVGSPPYHFNLGWLSIETPDGFVDEKRITAQLTNWLPRLMSDATIVGYSLNPGVVGTLTEIVREP